MIYKEAKVHMRALQLHISGGAVQELDEKNKSALCFAKLTSSSTGVSLKIELLLPLIGEHKSSASNTESLVDVSLLLP